MAIKSAGFAAKISRFEENRAKASTEAKYAPGTPKFIQNIPIITKSRRMKALHLGERSTFTSHSLAGPHKFTVLYSG